MRAGLGGVEGEGEVLGAVGTAKYLLCTAKMEVRMARIADRPAAIAGI